MRRGRKYRNEQDGFSLLELAIVLAVAGLIVTAIWIYAGRAYESAKAYNAARQIMELAQNIREHYQSRVTFTDTALDPLQQAVARADLVPTDMKATPNTPPANCTAATPCAFVHPWGGALTVNSSTVAGVVADGQSFFLVQYAALTRSACIAMATQSFGIETDVNMAEILINGNPQGVGAAPMDTDVAAAACNVVGAGNLVGFVFNIRS